MVERKSYLIRGEMRTDVHEAFLKEVKARNVKGKMALLELILIERYSFSEDIGYFANKISES